MAEELGWDEPPSEIFGSIANAIRSISHGGVTGPEGLEMLSMAISGEGPKWRSIGQVLDEGFDKMAEAIKDLSEAVVYLADKDKVEKS